MRITLTENFHVIETRVFFDITSTQRPKVMNMYTKKNEIRLLLTEFEIEKH